MASNAQMPSPEATAAAADAAKKIADNEWFVLGAYFLAFGIWTAAAGNDFISSTWKTVRATRRRGKLHVAFSFVPMIYISVYISYQIKSGNSQEMGAALLALAFAVLHLARSFMGLWQLHVFKLWTKSCIESMESLGYATSSPATVAGDAEYSDSDDDENDRSREAEGGIDEGHTQGKSEGEGSKSEVDPDDRVSHSDSHGRRPVLTYLFRRSQSPNMLARERERIERIADSILVNDTLIDNRLSDVHTVCSFRLLSKEQEKTVRKSISLLRRVRMRLQYGFLNAVCTLRVFFSLACLNALLFPNPESGPRLVPRRPESVWLNWATALVAQVGWMQDDNAHRNPDPSSGYAEHRNHFAEQILLSAAFHTRRTAPLEDGTDRSRSARVSSGFLAFQDWRNYPKLCSGQFSKQEFLKRACKTGFGLPYRVPHPRAVQIKEGSKQCGYGHFASELRRAREALPPEFEIKVAGFDVDELEWFSIFVSVENWVPLSSSSENPASSRGFSDSSPIDPKSETQEGIQSEDVSKDNDTPVENLNQQLGFVRQSSFMLEQSKLPFLRGISKVNLWGNRNVLEISCHIDNWMALCAADQADYMVKNIPWMEQKLSCKNLTSRESQGGNIDGDTEASIEKIVQQSVDFEKYRFMCQMTVVQPEYFHLEKSLSFLGCSMEMLRSSLAKWAEAHEGCDEGSWKPTIFSNEDVHESSQWRDLDPFEGTPDFTSCLRSLKCVQDMSQRFVKMRILWELQNHFQKHLSETGVTPSSIEAIVLCILSFPAVSIEVRGAIRKSTVSVLGEQRQESAVDIEHGHMAPFEAHNYEYVISASHGPQDIQLVLSVQALEAKSNALILLRLSSMEESGITLFDWEVWRDAFFARLEACRQWKEKVGIPSSSLIPSTQRISSGIEKLAVSTPANIQQIGPGSEISVWKGWLPHFASICLYEISTEGFILQPRKVERISLRLTVSEGEERFFNIPGETWHPVTYVGASAASLKIASLIVRDLLKDISVPRQQEEAPSHLARAELLLSQNSDADASLAVRLLESAAINERDTAALEKAMRILLQDVKKEEAIVRGADLLERFYVYETRGRGHVPSFFRNDSYVRAVGMLFEQLVKASGYNMYVALKYQLFLIALELYRGETTFPNAAHFMFQTILYGCHSKNVAESAESVLWSCFPFQSCKQFDEFAVLFLGYSNVAEQVDRAQKRRLSKRHVTLLDDVRYTANVRLGAAIQTVGRKKGGTRALELLGLSPHRTVDLYEQSIQERGCTNDMCYLGRLFEKGGHGIERNIPRAERLYRRAAEQNNMSAISNLADLLYRGEEGVEQDAPEAVELLNRAIDGYDDAHAMNQLAYILMRGENCCIYHTVRRDCCSY